MSETVALMLALLVMLVGLAGTLLPALPGIPLIWLAMLGYALFTRLAEIGWSFLIITLAVVILAQVAEHYARAWGATRFGAGKAGAWGAVVGSIVGLFFMPVGLLLGPFFGAMLFELAAGKSGQEAVRAGWGGLVGALGSVAVNFILGLMLVVAFVLRVVI